MKAELAIVLLSILGGAFGGIVLGKYPVFGNVTRKFDCPLPDGCPDYTEKFLTNYRYLNPHPVKECTIRDIHAALRIFQSFNKGRGLEVTGMCDNATLELFNLPRCGCDDMGKDDEKKMMPTNFYAPQEFNVGQQKWSRTHLKWKVTKYPRVNKNRLTNTQVDDAMRRGLDIWAQQTPLTFEQVSSTSPADIDIQFGRTRHTDRPPYFDFDGPGKVLAHAFFPESGVVHFDDDENFVLGADGANGNTIELFIVAAHEFGHTLGISHSNDQNALMAPYYAYAENLKLDRDDIQAIQYLYGAKKPQPRPVPTTPKPDKPDMPDLCNMNIQATFKLGNIVYVFTSDSDDSYRTVVYKVDRNGIDLRSRIPIGDLFKLESGARWPRAHPYRVDAATYIPGKRYIFLFSGTRSYRYTVRNSGGPFILDSGFPRWMNVKEFPERPRTAVAMPMGNNRYYMLIFGNSMVWDWDFKSREVGAWAFPIASFGRNMPTNVKAAFTEDTNIISFIKGDKIIKFNLYYRRVMEEDNTSVISVKKDFFKGVCA